MASLQTTLFFNIKTKPKLIMIALDLSILFHSTKIGMKLQSQHSTYELILLVTADVSIGSFHLNKLNQMWFSLVNLTIILTPPPGYLSTQA